MFAGPITYWARLPSREMTIPRTIVDRVNPTFAELLALLAKAKEIVPPGKSYTVRANQPDIEMALFNFSLADLRDHRPLPSSYYRHPLPDVGQEAQYVISFRCEIVEPGARVLSRIPEGCIYERL